MLNLACLVRPGTNMEQRETWMLCKLVVYLSDPVQLRRMDRLEEV